MSAEERRRGDVELATAAAVDVPPPPSKRLRNISAAAAVAAVFAIVAAESAWAGRRRGNVATTSAVATKVAAETGDGREGSSPINWPTYAPRQGDGHEKGPSSSGDGSESKLPTYSPSSLTGWPTYSPSSPTDWPTFSPTTSPFSEPIDFFLLGGQSNMVGHTTGGQSLGARLNQERSWQYWSDLKSTLAALGEDGDASGEGRGSALFETVRGAHEGKFPDAAGIARTLTGETMKLLGAGLLDRIDSPPALGTCSFVEPRGQDGRKRPRSSGTRPLVPGSGCGHSFGHELIFGRTLELQLAQDSRYELVKYASGGTVISKHWLPGQGTLWDGLNSTIHSRRGRGNWRGFVWHQGENNALKVRDGEDQSLTYLGNLTALVKGVREEMHSASPGSWECPEAIPVVIVQLGAWPGTAMAGRIRDAQAQFCESDPRSGLVPTDDLSPFYHFDPLSFLISGNRIAKAYDLLRTSQSEYTCPGSAPAPLDEETGEGTDFEDSAGTTAHDELLEEIDLASDGFSFNYIRSEVE